MHMYECSIYSYVYQLIMNTRFMNLNELPAEIMFSCFATISFSSSSIQKHI